MMASRRRAAAAVRGRRRSRAYLRKTFIGALQGPEPGTAVVHVNKSAASFRCAVYQKARDDKSAAAAPAVFAAVFGREESSIMRRPVRMSDIMTARSEQNETPAPAATEPAAT